MDRQNRPLREDKVYSSTGDLLYNKYPKQPMNWRTMTSRDRDLYESGISNSPKRLKIRDIE